MLYLLLINDDESQFPKLSPEQIGQLMADYAAFTEGLQNAGALVAAHRLQPTSTAKTVRVRSGKTLATDGPFAETKEQLGGYYLIEAKNMEEALAWAAKVPSARDGSVEVRPIWESPE